MSVLRDEPDEYIDAMFAVMNDRANAAQFGPDSKAWDE